MSELQPQPELRSRSELRVRSGSAPAGIARHGRLRRANPWPTILKIVAAALAVVLVSGASVAAIAFNSVYSKRTVVALPGETLGPPPQIGAIEGGFNILIVGSDTRAGQNGIGGSEEEETSSLNDVNILLHVSQDQTNATAVSFPRDMVVGIPECPWNDGSGDVKGYSTEPLNTALYYGGLPCVVQTLQDLTGLPIQFAGMITFQGVISMADAVGGVPVCVTGPIYDDGIILPEAGTYTLLGSDALGFLRTRSGVGDGSDLTRISSQQVYLSSLVRTLKSSGTLNDVQKLYHLADAAIGSMTLSTGLADVSTMVSIALALKNIPIERVTFVQYPGFTGGDGVYLGKVQPNQDLGDQLMAQIASDQPFLLEAAGDDRGSTLDPNAPAPDPNATPDPSAVPIDNTGLPVISGVRGQTAADYTCSIANN
jgi:LCP family protein required for cell wall assembly